MGEHGLAAGIEGLTIDAGPEGRGYLIASNQGDHTFKVLELAVGNRLVATIDPAAGSIGDLGKTDGLAVTAARASPRFRDGFRVL